MAVVKRTKSGRWVGIIRRRALGVARQMRTFAREEDARGWARKAESEIERGVWREADAASTMTLRQALDRYEREVVSGMRSAIKERSNIDILRATALARRPLGKITSGDVAALRDQWKRAGLAPATIRRRLHTLSHVYTVARKEWNTPGLVSPTHDVSLDREPPGRERRVTDAELAAIRDASLGDAMRDWVTLAVETAARRGEIFNARWEDVDTTERTWRIPLTKNGTPRTVPLSTVAAATLDRMRGTKTSGRVIDYWTSVDAVSVSFQRTVRRARRQYLADCATAGIQPDARFLDGIHLHDLRHEATSRLALLPGMQVHLLARVTGHKDLRMLMRYFNPSPSELAKLLP